MITINCDDPKVKRLIKWAAEYYNLYRVTINVIKTKPSLKLAASVLPTRRGKKHSHYTLEINHACVKKYRHNLECLLFHEVTHIKQGEQDGYLDLGHHKHRWHGQVMYVDEDNTHDYFNAPWEQEARLAESLMYYIWRKEVLGEDI